MVAYINPLKIYNMCYSTFPAIIYTMTGVSVTGDGDKRLKPFRRRLACKGIYERYIQGVRWEDTQYYHWRKKGKYGTIKDYDGFFKALDWMYEDMKTNGYNENPEPWEWNDYNPNHIGVGITRDGEYVWLHDGQHRLMMAQLLNIPKVPVRVIVIWQ